MPTFFTSYSAKNTLKKEVLVREREKKKKQKGWGREIPSGIFLLLFSFAHTLTLALTPPTTSDVKLLFTTSHTMSETCRHHQYHQHHHCHHHQYQHRPPVSAIAWGEGKIRGFTVKRMPVPLRQNPCNTATLWGRCFLRLRREVTTDKSLTPLIQTQTLAVLALWSQREGKTS